jgi:hypothetical protein
LKEFCKIYKWNKKTEKKKNQNKKKEKGSHWADPGTGPAQKPPNQPTRGLSSPPFPFAFSLFYFTLTTGTHWSDPSSTSVRISRQ